MAQVINTNVGALFAGAALNKSANALQTAQARLSSGVRINSAKDDATGLALATGYDSQIRGTNMAIRNANDGIAKAQTNDGYAGQVTENLQRLREIAVQLGGTASGTEATELVKENARLAGKTAAIGAVSSDGSGGTITTQSAALAAPTGLTIAAIDTDIGAVGASRANYGADMVSLGSAVSGMQTASVNLSSSYSRVMDTDYAAESASMTRNNILQQAGTAVLSQANQSPNSVLGLLR
ncbi:MAG: flagellin [Methyloglobulus sp.]|nr:flagellin [Methyloglobulus sp.]